jgi:hypothetical protein
MKNRESGAFLGAATGVMRCWHCITICYLSIDGKCILEGSTEVSMTNELAMKGFGNGER